MLFSEYYGEYYACVAEILSKAVRGKLTKESLLEITRRKGFTESSLVIPEALRDGSWPLLRKDLTTPLKHEPVHPVTLLQKRWLKTLLTDSRIRLFDVPETGLEGVEPLFDPEKIIWYDRYTDGDPFEDPGYIERFRVLLEAVKTRRRVQVDFTSHHSRRNVWNVVPYRLEYSQADDKFRLLCRSGRQERILNLKRLVSCRLLEPVSPAEYPEPVPENETVTLDITDERNALERAMLQFSYLAKKTERMGENTYRMTLQYRKDDETELVIRILSFGPLLKVIAPDSFAALIRERIERQVRRNET